MVSAGAHRGLEEFHLGDWLIRQGFCTFEQVHECLDIQRKIKAKSGIPPPLGRILIEQGYLRREQLEAALSMQARARAPVRPVPEIPGYADLEPIGRGAMGMIYRARQASTGRTVAVKVLARELSHDGPYVERFLREARSVARLHHPNIVAGIDAGEVGGMHYFVMEYVDGTNAFELLRSRKRLSEAECIRIGVQTCLALDHASRHGIVHRDIKPHNIMIGRDGTVKLCDLGLAKRTDVSGDPALTAEGISVGTPMYCPPEQARGERADTRSDIYSLGATLYHLAVGNPPFLGPTPQDVLRKHLSQPPTHPRLLVPSLSEPFAMILLKMLAKRPQDRFESPAAVLRAFETIDSTKTGRRTRAPTSRTTTERRRREAILRPVTERRSSTSRRPAARPTHTQRLTRAYSPTSSAPYVLLGGLALSIPIAALFLFGRSGAIREQPARKESMEEKERSGPASQAKPGQEAQKKRFHEIRMGEYSVVRVVKPWPEIYGWLEAVRREFQGTEFEAVWGQEQEKFVKDANEKADAEWRRVKARLPTGGSASDLRKALELLEGFPRDLQILYEDGDRIVLTEAGKEVKTLLETLKAAREHAVAELEKEFEKRLETGDFEGAFDCTDRLHPYVSNEGTADQVTEMRRRVFRSIVARALEPPVTLEEVRAARRELNRYYDRYRDEPSLILERAGMLDQLDRGYAERLQEAAEALTKTYEQGLRRKFYSLLSNRRFLEARRLALSLFREPRNPDVRTALFLEGFDTKGLLDRLALAGLTPGKESEKIADVFEAGVIRARHTAGYKPLAGLLLDLRALLLVEAAIQEAATQLERWTPKQASDLKTWGFKGRTVDSFERLPFDPPDRIAAFRFVVDGGIIEERALAGTGAELLPVADLERLVRYARMGRLVDLTNLQCALLHQLLKKGDRERAASLIGKVKPRLRLGWSRYVEISKAE